MIIHDAVPDSWSELIIVCRNGLVEWDYLNCRWVWKIAPLRLLIGDPVPHEWDFDLVIESKTTQGALKIK